MPLTALLFSGGRDSTLAAIRLARAGHQLLLVTVTSNHLHGIEAVARRIQTLATILPPETAWQCIVQPDDMYTDTTFYEKTCLPCHHAYVIIGAATASQSGARNIAFGYVQYQSEWPEQTPYAIARLRHLLLRYGMNLLLPVYDVSSRAVLETELLAVGVSPESMEQKCARQVDNVPLAEARLHQQVDLWEAAIDRSLQNIDSIRINTTTLTTVGALSRCQVYLSPRGPC